MELDSTQGLNSSVFAFACVCLICIYSHLHCVYESSFFFFCLIDSIVLSKGQSSCQLCFAFEFYTSFSILLCYHMRLVLLL